MVCNCTVQLFISFLTFFIYFLFYHTCFLILTLLINFYSILFHDWDCELDFLTQFKHSIAIALDLNLNLLHILIVLHMLLIVSTDISQLRKRIQNSIYEIIETY